MAWSRRYTRTSEPRPYDTVTFCSLCKVEVYVTRAPSGSVMSANHAEAAELAAEAHLAQHHALRYRLRQRLHWRWLVAGLR